MQMSTERTVIALDVSIFDIPELLKSLRAEGAYHLSVIADQIEAQTRPPKPPEPQGRYAVVVAIGGDEWVRDGLDSDLAHDGPWWNATQARECAGTQTRRADYADIDVVRVLSEGVQP